MVFGSEPKVRFEENEDGTYDLWVNGRVKEYDVEAEDFSQALRRARVRPTIYKVLDKTGYPETVRVR